jgi:hypothetical protein
VSPQVSPVAAEALGGGEAAHEVAARSFAEDVRVDREDGVRLVAQVLGDLVHRCTEARWMRHSAGGRAGGNRGGTCARHRRRAVRPAGW